MKALRTVMLTIAVLMTATGGSTLSAAPTATLTGESADIGVLGSTAWPLNDSRADARSGPIRHDRAAERDGGDADSHPWLPTSINTLVLEVDGDCPDDADAGLPGHQIAVELWMRNLSQEITGFQAFVQFDVTKLSFVSGTYTDVPFDQHIPTTITATPAGEIDVSSSSSAGLPGTSADSLLATFVFTVIEACESTAVTFRDPVGPFTSELSFEGVPVSTALMDTPFFDLDDEPPVLSSCPDPVETTVECDTPVPPPPAVSATDACDGEVTLVFEEVVVNGACPPEYDVIRTWTATDSCGNMASCQQIVHVVDTTEPVVSGLTVSGATVDAACEGTITFSATVTDNCCLDAGDVVVGVTVADGTLTYNPGSDLTIVQVSPQEVSITGTALVSDLTACPAVVTVTVDAEDCCDSAAVQASASADVIDTTAPVIDSVIATGGDVDDDCEFEVPFTASMSDNCCIHEEDVAIDVRLIAGTATLGTPSYTLTPNGGNGYDIAGSVPVSGVSACPATVQVTVFVTDCCGNPAGAAATTPDDGLWSESFVGGGPGQVGNLVRAWSDETTPQWTLWDTALESVVLVSDTVVGGDGERVYRTVYTGGQLDVDGTLLGGGGGMITADVIRHVHLTHQVFVGGVVDWGLSYTDTVTYAAGGGDAGLTVTGHALFVGAGSPAPPGYPPLEAAAGHWGTFAGITLTAVDTGVADLYDRIDPVISGCPDDITVNADAGGCTAVVTWTPPTATDNCGPVSEWSSHDPGDAFPVGPTTVTYEFTDGCGNASTCTFDVTVEAENEVTTTVVLGSVYPGAGGVPDPLSRCIQFVARETVTSACAEEVHTLVDFTPGTGGEATAVVTFDVACGAWDQLCAKDEQHTLYEHAALDVTGPTYTGAAPLILLSGDTDNDSDVDIHDVTWLMYQWSQGSGPAAPGGCPFDGTRDADFSNDDILNSTDYLMLSDNWLQWRVCPCTALVGPPPAFESSVSIHVSQLPPRVAATVDFNRDGVVDFKDVKVFESANGLSNTLSSQLQVTATPKGNASIGRSMGN